MPYDVVFITGDNAMRQSEKATLPNLCGIPPERMYFSKTLEEALQAVNAEAKTGGISVIVTDLSTGGVSIGNKVLEYVKENKLGIPVIIKSVQPEEQYAPVLLRKGAFAYYEKTKPQKDLAGKVREALAQPRK